MDRNTDEVGVIVARFQVPRLHAGHRYLIETVRSHHEDILIVLGSKGPQPTRGDPLSANIRRLMLQNRYPGVVMSELFDCQDDLAWSRRLDDIIGKIFPGRAVRLYGSRGSFIPFYKTKTYPTTELREIYLESGTHARTLATREPLDSDDFRTGVMYAITHRLPTVYPVVDIAVVDPKARMALLGQKDDDGDKYRFFGGFVDPSDESMEIAARRELGEETSNSLTVGDFRIIGTARIDDIRYRGTPDSEMSTFFRAEYISGAARAGDDVPRVRWFPYEEVGANLIDTHYPLGALFNQHIRDAE